MSLLAGYGQHPVQELLASTRTYGKDKALDFIDATGL